MTKRIRKSRKETPPAMKNKKTIPKELLSLAGEHRVASELCKLGVFATITPGNRKQTDLYAINDTAKRFVRIEVKASQTKSFVTRIFQKKAKPGYNPPEFWVLVSFRQGRERFFVLKNDEIEKWQQEINEKYLEGFRQRNSGKAPGEGVDRLPLDSVERADCENRWDKIVTAVGVSTLGIRGQVHSV
jgi:hypothetical protein